VSGISIIGHILLMFPGLALVNDMWVWADSNVLHFSSVFELLQKWLPNLAVVAENALGGTHYFWDPVITHWPAALVLSIPTLLLYTADFFFWAKRDWTPFSA